MLCSSQTPRVECFNSYIYSSPLRPTEKPSALKCSFTLCSTSHRKLRVCNEGLLTHFCWSDPQKICFTLVGSFQRVDSKVNKIMEKLGDLPMKDSIKSIRPRKTTFQNFLKRDNFIECSSKIFPSVLLLIN